uniref:Uncharacterized protein n=1 Tax=Arundo donax TaxID=35708 RepID=A0A0A8XZQ6_ARUDO
MKDQTNQGEGDPDGGGGEDEGTETFF